RQWSNDTVCKRDISEVHRRRLEIEQRLEAYLKSTGALTSDRLQAINQARFEMARGAWNYNRSFAKEIMESVCKNDPRFSPDGAAASSHYRRVFNALGFAAAERIAAATRIWRSAPGSLNS